MAKREESKDIAYECTIKNRMFAYARARSKNVQGRKTKREKGVKADSHDKDAHAYTRYCRTATRKIIICDQKR